ncbi:hydrolase, TatD family [Denitrovibrio acetiphilus DSM 12809]|uniref:Hydrolase, TatD family n=1 Tax=Denitrovibrio acetiphilus (strain DSM 12809 / NBRC 114555 / N2460) TaxID=522772 RepID=D4H3M2_DENA2|nr:TatD family hydrolase [Denitrovibrio acetiphilus]ADD69124.1 hydrolase, TatD family [Denitrovibrio acetiphilus DSM 12809]
MIKKRGSLKDQEFLASLKEAVEAGARFTDTHCHIHFSPLADELDDVSERAAERGVHRMVTVGIDLKDSEQALLTSRKSEKIFFTAGVHPHDAEEFNICQLGRFEEILSDPKAVAVGEIGLDYYRNHSAHDRQREVFATFLDMAVGLNKPVVIHNRESDKDCVDVMSAVVRGRERNGVIHCFSGDRGLQKWALDNGFYISYAGPVTYNSSDHLRDTVQYVPLDRLLIETDCPYLSPEPYRGRTNEPAHVVYTAKQICDIIDVNLYDFAVQLEKNYTQLFG